MSESMFVAVEVEMGWFKRRAGVATGSRLPSDIVQRVIAYMDYEEDPQNSTTPFEDINDLIYKSLYPIAAADPAAFAAHLAAAVLPVGGQAVRGGERLIADLISGDFVNPDYDEMLDSALEWLRARGVSSAHLTGFEHQRWMSTHPNESW